MSSSPIEDQISAGWAYALKALACIQRNYDALSQGSTSARISAEKTSERLSKAEERIKYLEGVRGNLATEASSLRRSASVLEGQVNSRDAEIGSLRRQLDSLRESWDVESRQRVTEALSDFHAKASDRMLAAKERLLGLKQGFIGPCFASAEVVDPEAESALTEELIGIARLIRLPQIPPPSIEDGMKGSSLEFLSAKVGVAVQAGSNLYSSVVDALLAEKRSKESTGAGTSTDACQSEQVPGGAVEVLAPQVDAGAVEVPASQVGIGVVAQGGKGPDKVIESPTPQEGGNEDPPQGKEGNTTSLPNTDEAAVDETLKEPESVPTEVTPTAAEVQDGNQVADLSNEVVTPPAKETLNSEEEKNSSGQTDIWDQIVL